MTLDINKEYAKVLQEIQETLSITEDYAENFVSFPLDVLKQALYSYQRNSKIQSITNAYSYFKGTCNKICSKNGKVPNEQAIEQWRNKEPITDTTPLPTKTKEMIKPHRAPAYEPSFAFDEIVKVFSCPIPEILTTKGVIDWEGYRTRRCDNYITYLEKRIYTSEQANTIINYISNRPKLYKHDNTGFTPIDGTHPAIIAYLQKILYHIASQVIDTVKDTNEQEQKTSV